MIRPAVIVLIVAVIGATVRGEEFKSQPAKDARQKYEEAMVAARKQYLDDLKEAAKQAVGDGDLEEVVRIKDAQESLQAEVEAGDDSAQEFAEKQIKLNKARKLIEGTTWKWKPAGTFTMRSTFLENRRVKHASGDGSHYGEWDMLEEHTLVMRRRPEGLWVFFFEDDYKSFRVMKLAPVDYKGSTGTRVK